MQGTVARAGEGELRSQGGAGLPSGVVSNMDEVREGDLAGRWRWWGAHPGDVPGRGVAASSGAHLTHPRAARILTAVEATRSALTPPRGMLALAIACSFGGLESLRLAPRAGRLGISKEGENASSSGSCESLTEFASSAKAAAKALGFFLGVLDEARLREAPHTVGSARPRAAAVGPVARSLQLRRRSAMARVGRGGLALPD